MAADHALLAEIQQVGGQVVRVVEGGSTANLSPKAGDEAPAKVAAMQQHHRQLVGCGGSCWSQRKKLVTNSIRQHTASSQKRPFGLLNNNDNLFIFAARRQQRQCWLMRTVITWASSGTNGDRTSCTTFIVDFDSESVVSFNICYPSYGCETDAHPDPRRRSTPSRATTPDLSEAS
jgi:hypothetical protein